MLVAKTIILCRPLEKIIQVRDILLEVDRKTVTRFALLEKILDGKVGYSIQLRLHRSNTEVEVDISVRDLYKITLDSFVSISSARGPSFHALLY